MCVTCDTGVSWHDVSMSNQNHRCLVRHGGVLANFVGCLEYLPRICIITHQYGCWFGRGTPPQKTPCVSTPTQSNPTRTTTKRIQATKNTLSPCTSIPASFGCFSTEEGHQPWRLGGERSGGERIWGAMCGRWAGEGLIDSTGWSRWSVNLTHGTNGDPFDMLGSWVGKLWKLHHRQSVELVCVPVFLHLGSLVRTWFCSYLWSVIRHLCMLASLFYVYPELRTYFHIPTTSILTLWWICWLPPINLFAGWLPRCGQ